MHSVLKGKNMKRQNIISFRVNKEERELILRLGRFLQRSKSDAIRFVLLQVLKKLENDPSYLDLKKQF